MSKVISGVIIRITPTQGTYNPDYDLLTKSHDPLCTVAAADS